MNYYVYYQRFFGLLRPAEIKSEWLPFTHRLVKVVTATSLDDVFRQMQGEIWSPRGEARPLIERLHLSHTSMSVGDLVYAEYGHCWLCDFSGWRLLARPRVTFKPPLWLTVEEVGQISHLRVCDRWDRLPNDLHPVEPCGWLAFEELVSLAKLMRDQFGWAVTIDLGDDFFDTGISPLPKGACSHGAVSGQSQSIVLPHPAGNRGNDRQ